jgi:hypothetical protein
MEWISNNTSSDSQFALLTGERAWFTDRFSEWFPALSGRISEGTVQGSEWLPENGFDQQIEQYERLQKCARQDVSCLFTWAQEYQIPFTHAYVVKPVINGEVTYLPVYFSLLAADQFELIYDNPAASIFRVVDLP